MINRLEIDFNLSKNFYFDLLAESARLVWIQCEFKFGS